MHPILFDIGPITVHAYGVFFAGGFLAAAIHWSWLGRRIGLPPGFGMELCIWVILSSVIGARTAFVIAHWSHFAEAPERIVRLDAGGLIYYGGLIGAAIGVILLSRLRRMPIWFMADFAISAVPLGHAIGRIGCLLNGCCYGAPTSTWWAIPLDGVMRHPVPILETTYGLVIYIILGQVFSHKHREGRVFALYLFLYPLGRFAFEFLRGDERIDGLLFNAAQELSLLLMMLGVALWFLLPPKRHFNRRRHAEP